jgi:hypothetical protein
MQVDTAKHATLLSCSNCVRKQPDRGTSNCFSSADGVAKVRARVEELDPSRFTGDGVEATFWTHKLISGT